MYAFQLNACQQSLDILYQSLIFYLFRHGKKFLDLSHTVRLSGLPNLAKLELVKSDVSRAEEQVIVALQLPNGERLQSEFPPSTTLWDLLLAWEAKSK